VVSPFDRGWTADTWGAEIDNEMLAPNSISQRWKNASIRTECRDAYRFDHSFHFACNENPDILVHRQACGAMEKNQPQDDDQGMDDS